MLEKLSEIPWQRLEHAYGIASDVPTLLVGLTSNNRAKRYRSLEVLYSTIWHQGTVYQATGPAVLFLCELLRSGAIKGKANILGLLKAIHSAYPQRSTKADPRWTEKPSPLDVKTRTASAKWARRARKAVAAEISTYVELLTNASPMVRGAAANLLVCCEIRSADIEERLRQAIDDERHPVVKAGLIQTWCRLSRKARGGPRSISVRLRHLVHDHKEEPVVRLTAAVGLAPFLKEKSQADLIRFLAWAYRKSGKAVRLLSRFGGSTDLLHELGEPLRLDLCLELAKKPTRSLRRHIHFDLESTCRQRRGNFLMVVPVLGKLLSDRDPEFRANVAMSLGAMGTWARFAQEPLVRALEDENPQVRLWSAVALGKLRDPRVMPFIIENLAPEQHTDLHERSITAAKPIKELVHIEQDVARQLRKLRLLLDALRPFGSAGREALPYLHVLLTTRGAHIQKLVCGALAAIGEPAKLSVPIVGKLLKNRDIQAAAAWALEAWGVTAAQAIPDLIGFLQDYSDSDSWAKKAVMATLGLMGSAAEPALPVLKKFLCEPDYLTKCAAAFAIWRIAPRTKGVIETLVSELKEKTKPGWAIHGCVEVIATLEAIGSPAKIARPILEKLLDDSNGWARVHAARALWQMGTSLDLLLPVLIDDLLCQPLGISAGVLAAECLAEIGPPAAAAIPRLKAILAREESLAHYGTGWAESDDAFREAAMRALSMISGDTG